MLVIPGDFSIGAKDISIAFVVSVTSCNFQMLMSFSCQLVKKASRIAILFAMQIVFSFVLGKIFLNQDIHFIGICGALFVAVSGILIVVSKEEETERKESNGKGEDDIGSDKKERLLEDV